MNKLFDKYNWFWNLKFILLLYLLLYVLIIPVRLIWESILRSIIKQEFIYERLIEGYNQDIIWDFFSNLPDNISLLSKPILILIGFYLLSNVAVNTTLIYLSEQKRKQEISSVIKIIINNILNLFMNSVFSLLMLIFWSGICLYIIVFIFDQFFYKLPSEAILIQSAIGILLIMLFGWMVLMCISVISKKLILFENKPPIRSYFYAIRIFFLKIRSNLIAIVFFSVAHFVVFYIYLKIDKIYPHQANLGFIYGTAIVQQVCTLSLLVVRYLFYRIIPH
ncbi:MAG: hypothetical protein IT267_00425 [Saprospiraceae bacterium]|nr:hypothetical protein [Saprospiraceae bacterium]